MYNGKVMDVEVQRVYHGLMSRLFWTLRSVWHRPCMYSESYHRYSPKSRFWNTLYKCNIGCSGGGTRRSQFCEWLEEVARHHEYGWEDKAS
jgi:hypothetical protein